VRFTIGELVKVKGCEEIFKVLGMIDGEVIGQDTQENPKMLIIGRMDQRVPVEYETGNCHFPIKIIEKVTIH
jgi:hypothetical protein